MYYLARRPHPRDQLCGGLLIGTTATAFSLTSPSLVLADDFGTCDAPSVGCLADNAAHSYCKTSGLDADLHQLIDDVMLHSLHNSTDMTSHLQTCQLETDAWIYDADLPGNLRGQTQCNSGMLIGNVCSSYSVTVDPAFLRIGEFDNDDIKKTFCHEIGHSVGLAHGNGFTDCMRTGEIPDNSGQWKHYSAHHKSHINAQY